jgi:hypothetical protein
MTAGELIGLNISSQGTIQFISNKQEIKSVQLSQRTSNTANITFLNL